MHVITILRDYLGMTQQELARRAKITQSDLSEMEHKDPYGQITKYQRVADVLNVPVHALVNDDCTGIPASFFETHEHAEYLESFTNMGREGEEAALRLEQERLEGIYPNLAKLVIPYYKLRISPVGYDILSFDDCGKPFFIEVKTTTHDEDTEFHLTAREYAMAQKLTAKGERYMIYRYANWGKENQTLIEIPFQTLLDGSRITNRYYYCSMKDRESVLSGLAYHRRRRGLTQEDLAKQLGILQHHLCRYEKGEKRCPVRTYQKIAELLEVTIDELLADYPISALEAE